MAGNNKQDAYARVGVDYDSIDAFKREGQAAAQYTSLPGQLHIQILEVPESRGESVFLLEFPEFYLAFLVEGLGTKNIVADLLAVAEALEYAQNPEYIGSGRTYYEVVGQSTIAMIINDLITSGAQTLVVAVECAAGSSKWFENHARAKDLIRGWVRGIQLSGGLYGPGETPVLKDMISPETVCLSGAAAGIIHPKQRRIRGNIADGDAIAGFSSSGVHANGFTLARAIPERLPKGYLTELPDGSTYGEALMQATYIYSPVIQNLLNEKVDIHYAINMTGHGWRKLMRAKTEEQFSYVVDNPLPVQPIFDFIQKHGGEGGDQISDYDMYANFNMGMGFAIIVPQSEVDQLVHHFSMHKYEQNIRMKIVGHVKLASEKQVVIPGKNIVFPGSSLDL